jgi:hypothetical protein
MRSAVSHASMARVLVAALVLGTACAQPATLDMTSSAVVFRDSKGERRLTSGGWSVRGLVRAERACSMRAPRGPPPRIFRAPLAPRAEAGPARARTLSVG